MNGPMQGPPPGMQMQPPSLRVRLENTWTMLRFLRPKRAVLVAIIGFHLLSATSLVPLMDFGRVLTDYFGQRESFIWRVLDSVASGDAALFLYIVLAALLVLLSGGLTLWTNYAAAAVREFLLRRLRHEVYWSLERLNMQVVNVRGAGDYVQGIHRDVYSVDMLFNELFNRTVPQCIFSLVAFAVLLNINASMTIALGVAGFILFPLFALCNTKLNALSEFSRNIFTDISDQLIETIGGFRDILASGRFDRFADRFDKALEHSRATGVRIAWWGQVGGIVTTSLMSLFAAVPIIVVAPSLLEAQSQGRLDLVAERIGATISYVLFLQNFLTIYTTLYQFFQQAALTAPSFAALRRMLSTEPEQMPGGPPSGMESGPPPGMMGGPPPGMGLGMGPGMMAGPPPAMPAPSGPLAPIRSIRFDHVRVGFGGRLLFEDLSFEIPGGKMTAIVGQSGSGKTTIMNLLLRLLPLQGGMIWVNDWPLPAIEGRALKGLMGLIPQDPFIFNTTVRENLQMAAAALPDQAALDRAIRIAQLGSFLQEKPEGLEFVAGHLGRHLSAGERQRLALARLVLQAPELIVCDEYTANVDVKTAQMIHAALSTEFAACTRIVISHQLYTVKGADHIIVLDHGQLVQQGSHEQLLAEAGLYRDLWDIQKLG